MNVKEVDKFLGALTAHIVKLAEAVDSEEVHAVVILNVPGKATDLMTCGSFANQSREYKIGVMSIANHLAIDGELSQTTRATGTGIADLLDVLTNELKIV